MQDWYERRNELDPGMAFKLNCGDTIVRLDHRIPGDGTDWSCDLWLNGHWSGEEFRIHPGDLGERLASMERS